MSIASGVRTPWILDIMSALGIGFTFLRLRWYMESRSSDWYRQPSTSERTMSTSGTTVLFTDTRARPSSRVCAATRWPWPSCERMKRSFATSQRSTAAGLIKSTGDGFLVVFSSCINGVAAALDIRQRLAEYNSPTQTRHFPYGWDSTSVRSSKRGAITTASP